MPRKKFKTRPRISNAETAKALKEQKKKEFIEQYEIGGAMHWAAAQIGLSADTIARWRKEDVKFDLDILDAYDR
ncbi:MAG TPA: hypothetical protein VIJ14_01365, partial [Rhabdochlamydiaceae bacterium]